MDSRVRNLGQWQAGVMSRRQLLKAGVADGDIRSLVRRRELTRVHRGVYMNHTGEPTWLQRAWAGVLALEPAVLWGPSALYTEGGTIHVGIDRRRSSPAPLNGVRVHHVSGLSGRADWAKDPPRMPLVAAAIDVAGLARTDLDAVAELARVLNDRRVTAAGLCAELESRSRTPRGSWLRTVVGDLDSGVCSALEHGYVARVLRPHGLPCGRHQVRGECRAGVVYRDWQAGAVIVELDGRLHHASGRARDRDFDRDLDAAADGQHTTRLGWGQVFDRPCSTAARLARIFERHRVPMAPRPCSPTCQVQLGSPVPRIVASG